MFIKHSHTPLSKESTQLFNGFHLNFKTEFEFRTFAQLTQCHSYSVDFEL